MISALLASGVFLPSEYGLSIEDLSCYEKLWRFCTDYQARAGAAPGLELVRSRFPDFVFLPGIDLNWASDQLQDASFGRHVRRNVHGTLQALGDGDYDGVVEAIRALAEPRRTHALAGLNAFDHANFAGSLVKDGLPIPFKALTAVTQTIGFTELWTCGAYTGHGKSQVLAFFAAYIAEAGYRVAYLSAEMPAESVNRRIIRYHARGDRDMQLRLAHPDPHSRLEALDELHGRVQGKVDTFDPSMVRMHTGTVEDATHNADIVMIDHIGLLQLPDGSRGVDDWRQLAKISNILREINLSTKTAMFNAVQTNKESDRNGLAPPKLSDLAGSVAIGQDSDVVITHRKPAEGLMSYGCVKNRENIGARWYTRFDPSRGDFREISKEEALNLKLTDEDRLAAD